MLVHLIDYDADQRLLMRLPVLTNIGGAQVGNRQNVPCGIEATQVLQI